MPIVALLVTEAELFAAIQCAQDMLFIMRVLHSLGLKVWLPMLLFVDNKGTKDICNGWSNEDCTHHIEVKQYFLHDLKEAGLISVVWQAGHDMPSNLFTKNLSGPLFNNHKQKFVTGPLSCPSDSNMDICLRMIIRGYVDHQHTFVGHH